MERGGNTNLNFTLHPSIFLFSFAGKLSVQIIFLLSMFHLQLGLFIARL